MQHISESPLWDEISSILGSGGDNMTNISYDIAIHTEHQDITDLIKSAIE